MKTQSGRSMIEIIGVLAVMGVLSIAVLYLYPYLVAHHKSNETWNDVLVQATVVQTSHTNDTFAAIEIVDGEELPSLITSEEFETSAVGYPMQVYKTNDVQFIVQVDNVDYDACEIILKKHSLVPDAIEVGNVKFEPIQENYGICGTSGTKTMYFYFSFCNGDINADCDCGGNFACFCGRCWCPIVGADAQTCQCPENYDIIDGECVCPMDKPYSYNGQCNVCSKDKPEQGKDGMCRVPCPSKWSVGIDNDYCFRNLGKIKASGASTACKNAGGFLPTLWEAQNYLGGTGLSVLLSDQRGNRCLKNGVNYFWIANLGPNQYWHTNFSCNNYGGYAYVSGYGEECHPETETVPTCLRKR